jgi:hypothetical protein
LLRSVLISTALLAAAFSGLPAAMAKPDLPTDGLVGYCTSATHAWCEGVACVGFSRQIPVCVDLVSPNGGPEPQCMPVYREYDFGAVRYVSKDSCSAEVYVNGEQVWPPTAQSGAVGNCVLLAFVHDYQWTYLCVEPKNTECAVYIKRVVGVTESRDCLVGVPATNVVASCVLVMYVADYQWTYLCVDPKNTDCAAYIKHVSGVTETRTCLVGVPAASPADAGTCVPTSGGLDYQSYACVEPKNAGCAVYTLSSTDSGVEKRCYGVLAPSCLDMYWGHEVGPVKVESRNSCHRQVYVFGEPVLP